MTKQEPTLRGHRVLVPRGGAWGRLVSKALRAHGATPVMSPLIDFATTVDTESLHEALAKLEAGYFDWMTAANPTIVDVLAHNNIKIAKRTQVALVGESTYQSFIDAGYEVARTTDAADTTAHGLLKVWPEINNGDVLRVLTMRSDIAKPVITMGLLERGHDVTQIVCYRTTGVPASVHVREDVENGDITAILVPSPTIAGQVASQFAGRLDKVVLACFGENTLEEAARLGIISEGEEPNATAQELVRAVMSELDPADLLD